MMPVTPRDTGGDDGLRDQDVDPDPIAQFGRWFAAAQAAGGPLPEAMTLATATRDGRPSARMVLLKDFDERGFSFYTGYESQKGRELTENPHAALVFYWTGLGRQVRITGSLVRLSAAESDAYFASRPYESRLSAVASEQSAVIPDRETLERRLGELRQHYPDAVPRPAAWGGYRLAPDAVEFWLHRDNRLHDRLRYARRPGGGWRIERLAP